MQVLCAALGAQELGNPRGVDHDICVVCLSGCTFALQLGTQIYKDDHESYTCKAAFTQHGRCSERAKKSSNQATSHCSYAAQTKGLGWLRRSQVLEQSLQWLRSEAALPCDAAAMALAAVASLEDLTSQKV